VALEDIGPRWRRSFDADPWFCRRDGGLASAGMTKGQESVVRHVLGRLMSRFLGRFVGSICRFDSWVDFWADGRTEAAQGDLAGQA
jgi:hypothetical protein